MERLTYRANGVVHSRALGDNAILNRLCELEDKLENGQIAELPKDKWVISRHAGKKTKYTYQVDHIEPYSYYVDGKWYIGMDYNPYRTTIEEYDTEEEANARLKELQGE